MTMQSVLNFALDVLIVVIAAIVAAWIAQPALGASFGEWYSIMLGLMLAVHMSRKAFER